jgi:hypothetical protein
VLPDKKDPVMIAKAIMLGEIVFWCFMIEFDIIVRVSDVGG